MIVAVVHGEAESEEIVILGVTRTNLVRLKAGEPLRVDAEHHPGFPEKLKICVVYGETERDIVTALKPMIGDQTKFIATPKPADQPKRPA